MLDTAIDAIHRSGLTVSLDHISLEDLIREAGVSRSAVYRRWPYKDLFLRDLLTALARTISPAATGEEDAAVVQGRFFRDKLEWLATPELRHRLLLELFRQGSAADFDAIRDSPRWRTYVALQATFASLEEGPLRDEVRAALSRSERELVTQLGASYERFSRLFGYRLRPELGATFDIVAGLANATLRGLAITALSNPELASRHLRIAPFGADQEAEWSLAGLGIASIALSFLEPDPTVVWDERRVAAVRDALSRVAPGSDEV